MNKWCYSSLVSQEISIFAIILQEKIKSIVMVLSNQLKKMRERKGLPQRVVAATLEIDTATYCKIEKGTMKPKREHISILATLFEMNEDQLLKDWLAEKIITLAMTEKNVALDALEIAYKTLRGND